MKKKKKTLSGFSDDAADKIWNDHIGNNAFSRHRDQCDVCLTACHGRTLGSPVTYCADGERIFAAMLDEVEAQIDEVLVNQN